MLSTQKIRANVLKMLFPADIGAMETSPLERDLSLVDVKQAGTDYVHTERFHWLCFPVPYNLTAPGGQM